MDRNKEKAGAPHFDTAHQAWDGLWGTEAGRKDWITAEREVRDLEKDLAGLTVSRVLDLGCGIGRHALFFASKGYQVAAIDASSKAVEYTRHAARDAGLSLTSANRR